MPGSGLDESTYLPLIRGIEVHAMASHEGKNLKWEKTTDLCYQREPNLTVGAEAGVAHQVLGTRPSYREKLARGTEIWKLQERPRGRMLKRSKGRAIT